MAQNMHQSFPINLNINVCMPSAMFMYQYSSSSWNISNPKDLQQMFMQQSHSSLTPPYSISPSPAQPTGQSDSPLMFYKGGQYTPGGGRAPAGGCYIALAPPSSVPRFYPGGQFTPGGGRAPKGGCRR